MTDFHMHTTYSDGQDTIYEMIKAAEKIGLKEIAITDHIWKSSGWFQEYYNEIKSVETKIKVYVGYEAKALSTKGNMDVLELVTQKADIRLGAIHRIPEGETDNIYLEREQVMGNKKNAYENWFKTSVSLLKNKDLSILAHPCMALNKYKIEPKNDDVLTLLKVAFNNGKKLELSNRYKLSNKPILDVLSRYPFYWNSISYGSDAHSKHELLNAVKIQF